MMAEFLFVYGTLMRASDHPMATMLADRAQWRGAAETRGRLYNLGRYPGFVSSSDAHDIVHGDLFALPAMPNELLAALDAYEGCGSDDPLPHPYARRLIEVFQGGSRITAWTYVFLLSVAQSQLIPDGRFAGTRAAGGDG